MCHRSQISISHLSKPGAPIAWRMNIDASLIARSTYELCCNVTSFFAEFPSGGHVGGAFKGFWTNLESFSLLRGRLFASFPFSVQSAG